MDAQSPPLNDRTGGFEVRYQHVIVEGTPYEAGRLQGEFLKQAGRTSVSYEPPEPVETARRMRHLYDEHCPGLIDETQGIADSLDLPFEKALFCAAIGAAHGRRRWRGHQPASRWMHPCRRHAFDDRRPSPVRRPEL